MSGTKERKTIKDDKTIESIPFSLSAKGTSSNEKSKWQIKIPQDQYRGSNGSNMAVELHEVAFKKCMTYC